MTYLRAPTADSPLSVLVWLMVRGCRLVDCRVYRGPDGWRGSGRVEG